MVNKIESDAWAWDGDDDDDVWPKREVHPDGSVIESWEGIHEYPKRLAREMAERQRTKGTTSGAETDDTIVDPWSVPEIRRGKQPADWLDDYEEGSTNEEFIDRMKRGMLLWRPDATPEEIARGMAERFGPEAGEEHGPDVGA